jgi:predicted pore-forming effector associated with SMODS systems
MTAHVAEVSSTLSGARGNAIPVLQNDEESLNLLAARSDRYACAFTVFSTQFVLAVAVPVILSLVQSLVPAMRSWATAYGVVIVLLIEPWLDRWQQRFREEAARVQERFDRRLFDLPWPRASLGSELSTADVSVWARRGRRRASGAERERWKNWYPVAAGEVPLAVARVICQQANAWWDSRQRGRSINLLRLGGFILGVALVAFALLTDPRLSVFVEHVLTVAPLVSWCLREAERHDRTVRARERVMEEATRLTEAAVSRSIDDAILEAAASDLQRDVYESRRDGPLMLPFIYDRVRDEQETAMCESADDAVRRYHAARAGETR